MEISKIKNVINEKIKKQQMGSIAEWRRQEKKSLNLRREQQKWPILKNTKKLTEKKINTPSGTCGTKAKRSNIWVFRIPEGEDTESGTEKVFREIMIESFTNLEKYRPTGSRRRVKSK